MAEEKDKEIQAAVQNGTTDQLGLLIGIPFSMKDSISLKGHRATLGLAYLSHIKMKDDAVMVKLFKLQGGIPLVKGNISVGSLSVNTTNPLYGQARTHFNEGRSTGGSSGGDAGLISGRCVPISIGGDIGGSLRFPPAFCGVYGFKPTTSRSSNKGLNVARKHQFDGFNHLQPTLGPMAKSIDDLVVGMRVQSNPTIHHLDPFTGPCPWNSETFTSVQKSGGEGSPKIKVGLHYGNTMMPVSKSVRRALDLAKDKLTDLGYEVVPFEITEDMYKNCRDILLTIIANGVFDNTVNDIENAYESPPFGLKIFKFVMRSGKLMRSFLDFMIKAGSKREHVFLSKLRYTSHEEFELCLKARYEFADLISKKQKEAGVAAVIMPIWYHGAAKLKLVDDVSSLCDYGMIANMCGCPSGVLPITAVQQNEEALDDDGHNDRLTPILREDMAGSENLPVGIQVLGHAYEDEQVLGIMKVLDGAIKFQ
mmetsp:Transcript_16028/g.24875  ORF Transcript_16028/g.24875 Transcript_16028/m.24875 type:complete len:479 (+) Transcript_16028:495-1931(+)